MRAYSVVALCVCVCAWAAPVSAEVWSGGKRANVSANQVITSVHGGSVSMAWRPVLGEAVAQATWVIPTPAKPEVTPRVGGALFDELERLVQLRGSKGPGAAFGARQMWTSFAQVKGVGQEHEVLSVRGDEAREVLKEELGGVSSELEYYIERGWWFTVVRYAPEVGESIPKGAYPGVHLEYDWTRATLPMRIIEGAGVASTRWYVFTQERASRRELEGAVAFGLSAAGAFGLPAVHPPKPWVREGKPLTASVARIGRERAPGALRAWLEVAGWERQEQAWVRVLYRDDSSEEVDPTILAQRGTEDPTVPALDQGERVEGVDEATEAPPGGRTNPSAHEAKGRDEASTPEKTGDGQAKSSCGVAGEGAPMGAVELIVIMFAWIGLRSRREVFESREGSRFV